MGACVSCSTAVPEDARFCPSCATPVGGNDDFTRSRPVARRPSETPQATRPGSSGIDHGRFLPGAMIGERYRVIALLGRGGMGEVYRADDLKVDQPVALKFLPARLAHDPERLSRLMGEVRAARQVAHPNVCHVYDVSEVAGEHFISMELVQGEDLATLLRRIGRLPSDKALQIARQLCAGLHAAHVRGLIHRDLKPANVMLDERGSVRIMDFGLAGAHFEGDAVREGTPAYMAPEQLAGRAVGVASDIYALGLVLYELFTGRHAFGTGTAAAIAHQKEHASPTPLTSVVEGVDASIERAILRCLERDPEQRPPSVAAVAAALPGGDPLAAALAAGETPSPDMVAAAGGEGALSPRAAWMLVVPSVLLIAAVLLLWPFSGDLGVSPLPRSGEALEVRAEEVLRTLGYEGETGDAVYWFERNYPYLLYEASTTKTVRRVLPWPGAANFDYRRSPRPLVPFFNGLVTEEDPPWTEPGMVGMRLAPRGELLGLVVVPPRYDESAGPWPEPQWAQVLAETGLDVSAFRPVEPRWTPPVASDVRRAWTGTPWPDRPEIRIEAASFHGRPVYVAVIGPWRTPDLGAGNAGPREAGVQKVRRALTTVTPTVLLVILVATVLLLARRNLALARGDRRGAFRVAAAVAAVGTVSWVFQTHHVADPAGEGRLFLGNTAFRLFWAGFVWLSYIALEPYLRRRWPSILIGWTRVVSGRFTDPLVGRDVLIGILFGCAFAVLYHLANAGPAWLSLPGQTPIAADRLAMGGAADLIALVANVLDRAIIGSLAYLGVLFLARLLVDRPVPATALTALAFALGSLGAENFAIEWVVAVASGVLPAVVLARYGVLALAAMTVAQQLLLRFPLTLELGRWYGRGSMFVLAVLAAMLVYGFRTALGGRPAFAARALAD
jgi:hypothetical protein